MHILHDADLRIIATFSILPECSKAGLREQGGLIEIDHPDAAHHNIHLERDAAGAVRARIKGCMAITGAPERAKVGEAMTIRGVPPGAAISLDGAELGVMDDSGELELDFASAGLHRLKFTLAGYIDEEISIEIDD